MKKYLLLFIYALILTTCLTACDLQSIIYNSDGTSDDVTQDFPVTIDEQTIESEPSSIAVLSGSLADVIISIGYEEKVVLASDDCTQDEYSTITKIEATDVSTIINSNIDLVLGRDMTDEMIISLNTAGIVAINIDNASNRVNYETLYTIIGTAIKGANTGYSKGLTQAQKIFTSLDDIARIIPDSDTVITGAFLIDLESTAVTGDVVANTVIGYCGVTNVFAGLDNMTYTLEDLLIGDPDFIVCASGLKDEIMSNEDFQELTAVINEEVYEVPLSYLTFEGSNLVSFATSIAGVAYPELLEEQEQDVELPSSLYGDEETESEEESSVDSDDGQNATTNQTTENEDDTNDTDDTEASTEVEDTSDTTDNSTTADEYDLENSEYTELELGDVSYDVYKLQERLAELGYLPSSPTDTFGTVTQLALMDFQAKIGVEETGTADVYTLERLYADDAPYAITIE